MNSGGNNDTFPLGKVFQVFTACHGQDLAVLICQSLAQKFSLEMCTSAFVELYCCQIISEVCVRVWYTVGEVHMIAVVLEGVSKSQTVVVFLEARFSLYTILRVFYIATVFKPADIFLLRFFL